MRAPTKKDELMEKLVKFDFQILPLTEIEKIVPTLYRDKYRELKDRLIEQLQRVPENSGFLFGNKAIKLPGNIAMSIKQALNKELKEQGISWRATFSTDHNLFAIKPHNRKIRNKPALKNRPGPAAPNVDIDQIKKLHRKGESLRDIADKLGVGREFVRRRIMAANQTMPIKDFAEMTKRLFATDMTGKDAYPYRCAYFTVGSRDLGYQLADLALALGMKNNSKSTASRHEVERGKRFTQEVFKLRTALERNK